MSIFFPPNQHFVFLNLFFLGAILCALSDLFSVKRHLFWNSTVICFVDDILYVFISGFLFLTCVFITNNGILRWYEFFACLSGFLLFKCTLSKLVTTVLYKICEVVRMVVLRIILIMIKILLLIFKPIYLMLKIMYISLKPLINRAFIGIVKYKIISSYTKVCRIGK